MITKATMDQKSLRCMYDTFVDLTPLSQFIIADGNTA